jgi:hypothetical protein
MRALALLCLVFAGCTTVSPNPKPDPSIVVWGVADPHATANEHGDA